MKYILITSLLISYACSAPAKKEVQDNSNDLNFNLLQSPATVGSEEPYLFSDANGKVYLSWINDSEDDKQLYFASLDSDKWSEPIMIASGNDWFVNWADFPAIGVNKDQNMMAHFLAKSGEGSYAYDVNFTLSGDAGQNWSEPKVLHDDGLEAEHGFVTIIPYEENFFVTWLDGRNTLDEKPMTIRAAIVSASGEKLNEWELDDMTCDCCQTTAAITANGPIVIYRNRSEEEYRDMSIVRLVGDTWTAPKLVFEDNWKIAGCPVNGPKTDAIDNNLAIAWFTAPDGVPQVNLVFSTDGGENLSTPLRIDDGSPIGRVDVVLVDGETAIVSWMEGSDIKVVKANKNAKIGKSSVLTSSSSSRSSGFPHITKSGDKLIFAWTALDDDELSLVKTAQFDI